MDLEDISITLMQIYEVLKPKEAEEYKVAIWKDVARRLSKVAGKNPAWGWRYAKSVAAGTVEPSGRFGRAVELLTQELDGTPVELADAEAVSVMARAGQIRLGSLVLGKSKACGHPGCLVTFVPVVPWQLYCPRHKKSK